MLPDIALRCNVNECKTTNSILNRKKERKKYLHFLTLACFSLFQNSLCARPSPGWGIALG